MLNGVVGDAYITVVGGHSPTPYIQANPNNPMQGILRIIGSDTQVFDGTAWISLQSSYATITPTFEFRQALDWARKKMQEEAEWEAMAKTNNSVAIALENLNKAKAQLTTTAHLSREHESTS